MIGQPVTDEDLDSVENQAKRMVEAVIAKDWDTAYIISQTCEEPGLLAMFAIELALNYE